MSNKHRKKRVPFENRWADTKVPIVIPLTETSEQVKKQISLGVLRVWAGGEMAGRASGSGTPLGKEIFCSNVLWWGGTTL